MKVFDYTDGKRGELLAKVKMAGFRGGYIVVKDDCRFRIELQNEPEGWDWACEADNGFGDLKPETFGVQAICFCLGEWNQGLGVKIWEWVVLGTNEWNREACKKGILKPVYLGPAYDEEAA